MFLCVCSVIDNRGRQTVVRTSVTHSAIASCATFLFLPQFEVICQGSRGALKGIKSHHESLCKFKALKRS